jgi:peptidoglycan/xylan/chitin deacetylase (PgdA/CDA1 family)
MRSRDVRTVVKSTVERTLVGLGAGRWAARRHRSDVCILAYHNVVPDDGGAVRPPGDASLHLELADFRRQLAHIGRHYEVVPLSDVLTSGRHPARPRVAITFDDAYHGALTLGVDELARHGFPATVFVPPGLLGAQALWWDAFTPADAMLGRGLTPAMRTEALSDHGGRGVRVREWALRAGWVERALPQPMLTGTEADLTSASRRHDGLTYGSHSWSHPDLAQLQPGEREVELRTSLAWLRARYRCTVGWLSYPYGISSPATELSVQAEGYDAAVLVSGSWTGIPVRNRRAIPRLNIPAGISLEGFSLRVSGFLRGG